MDTLKVIRDSDIDSAAPEPSVYKERKAARAVIFDTDGRVALVNAVNKNYHKLPGGGIEEGEDNIEALKRECMEEIGCTITNVRELGVIEEYRNELELHQVSYNYVADLLEVTGETGLEGDELVDGFSLQWLPLSEAIETMEKELARIKHYEGRFICLRDLCILKASNNMQAI